MIQPPATLGMLGGGQLGRYFVIAAQQLGYRVMVLDPDLNSTAGRIADVHIAAAYDDRDALQRMAQSCAAITTEFESVPAETLAYLATFVPVQPSAEALATCQNRSAEKGFLKTHGFPHAPYADIRSESDALNASADLFPGILKVARFGYDGKGQVQVSNREEALAAFRQFGNEACVLEKKLALDHELSVVLTRCASGDVKCFPVAENHHQQGILDHSIVAAQGAAGEQSIKARSIAEKIALAMDYVGTLSVEFFVVDGQLYVNELAPRPHNSGHYTLDACLTNQFEQQVRALCGLPLGEPSAHSAAVMVNLLGDIWFANDPGQASEPDWEKLLAYPGLKLHLYGKGEARPGRKMGHFTVLGKTIETPYRTAMAARQAIGLSAG
ncbi:MAG: phosphoribosylaminoimidazole carboxylase ATPase subunit [Proteobacteria bacterium]|nr:phosphoribosylaminoimidazole carboxylase ATPase subunit [Pseudomonadota bacterium]